MRAANGPASCEAPQNPTALIAKANENPVGLRPNSPIYTNDAEARKTKKLAIPKAPMKVSPTKRASVKSRRAPREVERRLTGVRRDGGNVSG